MIPLTTTLVIVYGAFCIVGGLIGYVKAQSTASLVAGIVSGLILAGCGYRLMQGHRDAAVWAAVVALLLGGRFVGTWRKTHRVMPDLVMIILSLATLLTVGGSFLAQ